MNFKPCVREDQALAHRFRAQMATDTWMKAEERIASFRPMGSSCIDVGPKCFLLDLRALLVVPELASSFLYNAAFAHEAL